MSGSPGPGWPTLHYRQLIAEARRLQEAPVWISAQEAAYHLRIDRAHLDNIAEAARAKHPDAVVRIGKGSKLRGVGADACPPK